MHEVIPLAVSSFLQRCLARQPFECERAAVPRVTEGILCEAPGGRGRAMGFGDVQAAAWLLARASRARVVQRLSRAVKSGVTPANDLPDQRVQNGVVTRLASRTAT